MSRLSVVSADKVNSTTEQLMKEFTQRIVANPPGVCPVDMQLAFLKVCHAQTCGKCVPCRIGLGQLEDLLEKVLDNEATMDTLKLIEQTAENIKNSADCAIGFLLFGDGSLWSGRCKKIRQDWLEDHGNLSFDYVFCSIYRCDFR